MYARESYFVVSPKRCHPRISVLRPLPAEISEEILRLGLPLFGAHQRIAASRQAGSSVVLRHASVRRAIYLCLSWLCNQESSSPATSL